MNPQHLLTTFGTVGLLAVVFAETGLLVGFFLPGDSLLVLAGLFCAVGRKAPVHLDLPIVLLGLFGAAVAGAQTAYFIGRHVGPALFRRPDSRLFKRQHVDRAQRYFDEYGPKTIVVARFIPVVRTFANPMAGIARMEVRTFALYNTVGALLWAGGVTMLGFVLGKTIPSAQDHLTSIEAAIIAASIIPLGVDYLHSRRRHRTPKTREAAPDEVPSGLGAGGRRP
jgi:membrane-associated protein